MAQCHLCKRGLDDPRDPTTADCGGDCLRCMAAVGDPDCRASFAKLERKAFDRMLAILNNIRVAAALSASSESRDLFTEACEAVSEALTIQKARWKEVESTQLNVPVNDSNKEG